MSTQVQDIDFQGEFQQHAYQLTHKWLRKESKVPYKQQEIWSSPTDWKKQTKSFVFAIQIQQALHRWPNN